MTSFQTRYPGVARIDDFGMGVDDNRPNLPNPHLSNSQRVGYSICPAAYNFERNDKTPRWDNTDTNRGSIIHAGIATAMLSIIRGESVEDAMKAGHKQIDDCLEEFKENLLKPPAWIAGYMAMPRWKNGPLATVETLTWDTHDALDVAVPAILEVFTPVSVEHGFAIYWNPGPLAQSPHPSVGFTDLAAFVNATGDLAVLDCKTGSVSKSLADVKKDDALVLYAPPIEAALGDEVKWLTYCNIVFGCETVTRKKVKTTTRTITVKFTGEDYTADGMPVPAIKYNPDRLRRVQTHQHALQRMIEREEFTPIQTGWACDRCAHLKACEEKYGPTGSVTRVTELEPMMTLNEPTPANDVATLETTEVALIALASGEPTPAPEIEAAIDVADASAMTSLYGLIEGVLPFVGSIGEQYGYAPGGLDMYVPERNPVLAELVAARPQIARWERTERQALVACESRGQVLTGLLEQGIDSYEGLIRAIAARVAGGEDEIAVQCGPFAMTTSLKRILATLCAGGVVSSEAAA